MKDQEAVLEIGFLIAGLGMVAALGVWLFGQVTSASQRAARYAEEPPAAGTIEAERHQHISTVAAR